MARQHIYTVLSGSSEAWSVVKMDRDFEEVETYHIAKKPYPQNMCTCFAGCRATCRHREILQIFQDAGCIDSRRAYDFDKQRWIDRPAAAMEML